MAALSLSTSDQQIWKKVKASKNSVMTVEQICQSLPGMAKREISTSIQNLVKLRLFASGRSKENVPVYHAVSPEDARKRATLTDEQRVVLRLISDAGTNGIPGKSIRAVLGADSTPNVVVRKILAELEKEKLIKSFKTVQAPTVPYYCLTDHTPPETATGGVWYDKTEFDEVLVEMVGRVLLDEVKRKTLPDPKGRDFPAMRPIVASSRLSSFPTPQYLCKYVNALELTSVKLEVRHVMQIMKKLELDGYVELVKPLDGVDDVEDDEDENEDEDQDEPSSSKRPRFDLDEDEEARRREKEREKARAKLLREKEKKKAKEKKKQEEKKQKAKEKKAKEKEKARERRRRAKAKEKKRKKRKTIDNSDESENDSDELVAIGEVRSQRKRKRSLASESSESEDESDSDADSDDSDDSDDDSDSDDALSIESDDIDNLDVPLKRKTTRRQAPELPEGPYDALSLKDKAVVFRAVNRVSKSLQAGDSVTPCGNVCPVWSLCEEKGAVNPARCDYMDGWLSNTKGGWSAEALDQRQADMLWADDGLEALEDEGGGLIGMEFDEDDKE